MRPLNVAVFYLNVGKRCFYGLSHWADLKLTVTVSTATGSKEVHPIDSTSPNATYYTDFISTMLKEAQDTLHPKRDGSRPEVAAQWIRGQCEKNGRGGVLWFASSFASLN